MKVTTREVGVNVGVRELRDGLSRHLAEVRAGHIVTVTDHGRPVARIVPVDAPNALERLVADGRVELARAKKRPAPKPIKTGATVSDLIGDQRR
jgi:prevent-host-death family protein